MITIKKSTLYRTECQVEAVYPKEDFLMSFLSDTPLAKAEGILPSTMSLATVHYWGSSRGPHVQKRFALLF